MFSWSELFIKENYFHHTHLKRCFRNITIVYALPKRYTKRSSTTVTDNLKSTQNRLQKIIKSTQICDVSLKFRSNCFILFSHLPQQRRTSQVELKILLVLFYRTQALAHNLIPFMFHARNFERKEWKEWIKKITSDRLKMTKRRTKSSSSSNVKEDRFLKWQNLYLII